VPRSPTAIAEATLLGAHLGFTEGPVFLRDGGYAVVSLDHGCVYRISSTGQIDVLADTGQGPNGLAQGADGTLFVAQSGLNYEMNAVGIPEVRPRPPGGVSGALQAIRADGRVETLSEDPYMPNDLCFGPDGHLYMTDPTRSSGPPSFRADGRIWRFDVRSRACELMASVPWFPNGIGFGPDDDVLYVASTSEDRIYRMALVDDGFAGLGTPEVAVQLQPGAHPDGFAFDVEGNLLVATNSGGVQVFSPRGALIEQIPVGTGRFLTNVAIDDNGRMLVCDGFGCAVHVLQWRIGGMPLHPFRARGAS
jgi:gluconolactonase